MPYNIDWKPTKSENPQFVCRKCGSDEVKYRIWESSDGAYEDRQYKCDNCKYFWWIEGPDY